MCEVRTARLVVVGCSGLVAISMHFNLETVANVTLSFGDTLLIRNNFGNVLTITTELRQQSGDHCTHFCSTVCARHCTFHHMCVLLYQPWYQSGDHCTQIQLSGLWVLGYFATIVHCTNTIISVQFSYGAPWRQTTLLPS